ncbi:hypothetical protein JCM3765_006218 [Sporobolomyces pararoseus]
MDRLPFELLGHISDCISLEPLPQLRQGSLASLSRTNKTFYTATLPVLYRDPVLLSDWRARCYERTIGNKVNPWLLSGSRRKEKQWWMPRRLTFEFPTTPEELAYIADFARSPQTFCLDRPFPRSCPHFEACSMDFVWSNLVCLKATNCSFDGTFLATILCPGRNLGHQLQALDLDDRYLTSTYVFLFEAAYFVDSIGVLRERVKIGADYPRIEEEQDLEAWERHEGGQKDEEAWDRIVGSQSLHEKARFDYGLWQEYFDVDLSYCFDTALTPLLIHTTPSSDFPFSSLCSLSIRIWDEMEFQLIFYTSSFPSLRLLKIRWYSLDTEIRLVTELDLLTFRYSITRCQGAALFKQGRPELVRVLAPLSEVEERDYPLKPYRGPDLLGLEILDLR